MPRRFRSITVPAEIPGAFQTDTELSSLETSGSPDDNRRLFVAPPWRVNVGRGRWAAPFG